jgi:hypothetical protein
MLLFISTEGILLVVALLLVMDLTIFQTVLVLLLDCNRSLL